jgi:hypothetical protein
MARTKQTTKQSAAACYAERFAETQDLLQRIARQLAAHRQQRAAEPADWGFPGDLDHVNEELAYVLASLGDRSAVEAKGLEC